MQPSMEVRWFLSSEIPRAIEDWFRTGYVPQKDALLDEESRDDVYLSLLDNQALGIKLRPLRKDDEIEKALRFDKVEIKQRQADTGVQILRPGIEGCVERWVKWSFPLLQKNDKGEPVRLPDIFTPPGHWIVVQKRRLTRKFEVSAPDKVVAVNAKTHRPDEGCNMEIAWLEANGQKWWSLGFEAFGLLENVERNLQLVLLQVVEDPAFPEVRAEQSYAYPAWLGMILKSESSQKGMSK